MKSGRGQQLAVMLMLGVTVVAAHGFTHPAPAPNVARRFLAVDNTSGRALITVVTDDSTVAIDPSALYAGLRVRVYGTPIGKTIRAQRIEVME